MVYTSGSTVITIMHQMIQPLVINLFSRLASLPTTWDTIPPPQDEAIADALVQGLELAKMPNHASRTCEPLVSHLQHANPLNETELVGSLKAIINNVAASATMKDMMLLERMRYLGRHSLHLQVPDVIEDMYFVSMSLNARMVTNYRFMCACVMSLLLLCVMCVCYTQCMFCSQLHSCWKYEWCCHVHHHVIACCCPVLVMCV